jgi:hypothetical protein
MTVLFRKKARKNRRTGYEMPRSAQRQPEKSLLLLFFRKEGLPFSDSENQACSRELSRYSPHQRRGHGVEARTALARGG